MTSWLNQGHELSRAGGGKTTNFGEAHNLALPDGHRFDHQRNSTELDQVFRQDPIIPKQLLAVACAVFAHVRVSVGGDLLRMLTPTLGTATFSINACCERWV